MPYDKWQAWRHAHELALAVYAETFRWPSHERYGLVAQARRAAVSIPANLAEGSARLGSRELRRFVDVGLGSLAELGYLLLLARELGYLSAEEWARLDQMRDTTGKLLFGIVRSLKKT